MPAGCGQPDELLIEYLGDYFKVPVDIDCVPASDATPAVTACRFKPVALASNDAVARHLDFESYVSVNRSDGLIIWPEHVVIVQAPRRWRAATPVQEGEWVNDAWAFALVTGPDAARFPDDARILRRLPPMITGVVAAGQAEMALGSQTRRRHPVERSSSRPRGSPVWTEEDFHVGRLYDPRYEFGTPMSDLVQKLVKLDRSAPGAPPGKTPGRTPCEQMSIL